MSMVNLHSGVRVSSSGGAFSPDRELASDTPGSTLVGTPEALRARIDALVGQKIMVVSFDQKRAGFVEQLASSVNAFICLMEDRLTELDEAMIRDLVSVLTPKPAPHPSLVKAASIIAREAAMRDQARAEVLSASEWLSAADVSKAAGLSATNPSSQPNKWKRDRQVFAINQDGADLFPIYAFDRKNFRPLPGLKPVLKVFGDKKDGWGLAFWFAAVNSFLGGKRPLDLLLTDPERLVEAAKFEVEGVVHA